MGVILLAVLATPTISASPFETASPLYSDGLRLSTGVGGSKSMGNVLSIHRHDGKDYVIEAQYDSKPYDDSSYWAGRLEWWENRSAWELEIIHHKLYLMNPPPDILDFSISDGYNLVYINRAWALPDYQLAARVGVGVVVAHPDITFSDRGRYILKGLPGLRLAGPSVQVALEQRYPLYEHWYLKSELKLTASYAKTAISDRQDEYVVAPDIAIHWVVGIGSQPPKTWDIPGIAMAALPAMFPYTTGQLLGWK